MSATVYHRFAWDGISCEVPGGWELGAHHALRGVAEATLEDAEAVRMQLEWLWPHQPTDVETVRRRYLARAQSLEALAERLDPLPPTAVGWIGHLYRMPEDRTLLAAYHQPPVAGAAFVFLRLHFAPSSPEEPLAVFRHLADSFRCAPVSPVPWAFYDVSFALDPQFRLAASALEAGRKLVIFQWGLRRLFLWHFSLAELIRERGSFAEFAAQALNDTRLLPAVRFVAAGAEGLAWPRRSRYPLGHAEEIGRWCFRYHAELRHLPERNQLAVWVFNFRNPDDLTVLRQGLRLA